MARDYSRIWRPCVAPVLAALALALGVFGGARADAAPLPPQGTYDQCGPALDQPGHGEATCLKRLAMLSRAGFRLNLNYTIWYSTPAQLKRYMDRAYELGVKLIWPLNAAPWRNDGLALKREYPTLGGYCLCLTNDLFRRFAIGLVKNHPATWGYYIGDELPATELPAVGRLRSQLDAIDPRHPRLYVSMENRTSLGSGLEPFAPLAEVAGADVYPVGTGAPISAVGSVMRAVRRVAESNGRRSAAVLQAFDVSRYSTEVAGGWPTRWQMQWMRDLALREGRPGLILWYSLQDIARSDDPAGRFEDLRAAAFAPPRAPPGVVVPVQRLRVRRLGPLEAWLRCNPAEPGQKCRGQLRIRRVSGRRILARGRFSLAEGNHPVALRVRRERRGLQRLLKRRGHLRIIASVRERSPRQSLTRTGLLAFTPGIVLPPRRLVVPRHGRPKVWLRCDPTDPALRCRGTLRLRRVGGRRTLAQGRFELWQGDHQVFVRARRRLRRLLRRHGRLRVVASIAETSPRHESTRRRVLVRLGR